MSPSTGHIPEARFRRRMETFAQDRLLREGAAMQAPEARYKLSRSTALQDERFDTIEALAQRCLNLARRRGGAVSCRTAWLARAATPTGFCATVRLEETGELIGHAFLPGAGEAAGELLRAAMLRLRPCPSAASVEAA